MSASMRRRKFITLLGAAAAAWPLAARAQQPVAVPRIGYLASTSDDLRTRAFRQGLRELGYIEGQNIVVEYRMAEGSIGKLPDFVSELVRLKVAVIFTRSTAALEAASKATTTIPIVSVSADPVGEGFAASLRRPGGNITGLANFTSQLAGKRLDLLKAVVPKLSRVAVLWRPDVASAALRMRETVAAASSLGVSLAPVEVRGPNDFEPAFSAIEQQRVDALVPLRSNLINLYQRRIVELAANYRLPAVYDDREFPAAGGLMSYGTMLADLDRRAATYVDKILKGAKPSDLPIEQPTKFELVINLKTAKALGIDVPLHLQQLADEVIE